MTTTFDPSAFDHSFQQSMARPPERGAGNWKIKEGRNVIRILPPHPNMKGDIIIGMRVHFSLGPKLDTWAPCLEFFGEACPACDWNTRCKNQSQNLSRSDPNQAKQYGDMAYKQRAQWRFGMNIIDVARPEAGVQKYYVGSDLEKKIRLLFFADDINPATGRADVRDLTHPETGRDIILEVSKARGRVNNQEYLEITSMRPKDTPTKLMDPGWVDQVFDLMEDRYHATVEEISGALQGKRIERGGGTQRALPQAPAPATVPLPPPPGPRPPLGGVPVPQAPAPAPAPGGPVVQAPPEVPLAPTPGGAAQTPSQAPPPVPAASGRSAAPEAEALAQAPVPDALPTAPEPPKVVRQPFGVAPAPQPGGSVAGPRAAARAMALAAGFTPGPTMDITEDEILKMQQAEPYKMPPCYKMDPEPKDPGCQACRLLLSCLTHKHGLAA
jgi:hypothetical protein